MGAAVPIGRSRYIWRESALTTAVSKCVASFRLRAVLPTAVGPTITMRVAIEGCEDFGMAYWKKRGLMVFFISPLRFSDLVWILTYLKAFGIEVVVVEGI